MSWTYSLYSPLPFRDAEALVDACDRALSDYLEAHPGADDEGCVLPEPRSYRADSREANGEDSPEVAARLRATQSCIDLRNPGDTPLMVAVMVFLLERMGPGACLMGDGPLQRSEEVLAEFRRQRHPKTFGRAPAPLKRRVVARRNARPNEVETLRLHRQLNEIAEDALARPRLGKWLAGASGMLQRYVSLLIDGPLSHSEAANALGCSREEVEAMARQLETECARLFR